MAINNHNNIQPPQRFNSPTVYLDQDGSQCYVYDPAAWRNKNKQRTEEPVKLKDAPKPKTLSLGAPRKDLWSGSPA